MRVSLACNPCRIAYCNKGHSNTKLLMPLNFFPMFLTHIAGENVHGVLHNKRLPTIGVSSYKKLYFRFRFLVLRALKRLDNIQFTDVENSSNNLPYTITHPSISNFCVTFCVTHYFTCSRPSQTKCADRC